MPQVSVYFDTKLFDLPIPRSRPIANQAINTEIQVELDSSRNDRR